MTIRLVGLKSRKGVGGRPRKSENALSKWIDEHLAEGDDDLTPRERFARLVEIDRTYVGDSILS